MAEKDYETTEGPRMVDGTAPDAVEQARRLHHLATADPEIDGMMTGPAHEEKYGLERAAASAAYWRAVGVHPTENRALEPGEDGYVGPGGVEVDAGQRENTSSRQANETATPPASA